MKMKKNLLFMLALLVSVSMVFVACNKDGDDDIIIDNPYEYVTKAMGTYKGTATTTETNGEETKEVSKDPMSVTIEENGGPLVKITLTANNEKDIFDNVPFKEDGSFKSMKSYQTQQAETEITIKENLEGKVADNKITLALTIKPLVANATTTTITFEGTLSE